MGALIELRDVGQCFPVAGGSLDVLRGIHLDIDAGEFIAVMGPSGSGKTTLLEILGAIARPSAGTYRFDGWPLSDLDDDARADLRAQCMGFVFQSFNLMARLSAQRNAELPLLYSGVKRRERGERARAMLERVGLGHRLNHRPGQLSGGECQRVGIARALVNSPRVIFADEPTGNLDQRSGGEILSLFKDLHGEGRTIIVVTHDSHVAAVAERVVQMRDGCLEFGGTCV